MKIEINIKIFFVLIFLFVFDNIVTYLIFLCFILIHELAHLVVGIIIGGIPKKMSISVFGVSIEFYSYGKNKAINKLIFFSSGPIINLIICALCYNFMSDTEMKFFIVATNFAICIFNLLPILPLDGGKILREILKMCLGSEKANKTTIIISKIILSIATLIYSILIIKIKNIIILFLLMYLWYLYSIEKNMYNLYLKTKNAIKEII